MDHIDPDALDIETRRDGSTQLFVIRGGLDLASTPPLHTALLAVLDDDPAGREPCELIVDVSQVSFLDCTAVGMLVQVHGRAQRDGHTLRVTGATGIVLEVLEIAGVAKSLGVYLSPGPEPATTRASGTSTRSGHPSDQLIVSMLDAMSQLAPGSREHTRIRAHLVNLCAPFATALARRFSHRGEPFDDLNQVAMVGLLKAVDGYDPQRGRDFIAYATPTVLGELRRHFRDRTWAMTVPRRHKDMRLQVNALQEELTQKLGRTPSVAELSEHLNVSTEDVLEAMEAAQAYQSTSLSMPVGTDDSITLADVLGAADPDLDAAEDRMALAPMIARLPDREQRILTMRFYGNMTQSQIADEVGVSQMHVSRLLKGALGRLREELMHEGA